AGRRQERRALLAAAGADARAGGHRDRDFRSGAGRGGAEPQGLIARRPAPAAWRGRFRGWTSTRREDCWAPRAMTEARQILGKTGEDLACRELEARGYAIVARRYRERGGEIDIIARDGATLVFVEVKTRIGRGFGDPTDAIARWKRRRMKRIALEYMMRQQLADGPCRFDVVSILVADGAAAIE